MKFLGKNQKAIRTLLVVGIFVCGLVLGQLFSLVKSDNVASEYPLLAKRIQIDNPNDVRLNFAELENEISKYLGELGEQNASKVSVYFEYLPSGVSININENNNSIAASLMKLPAVMNIYKAAETGKIDIDKQYSLAPEWLNREYGTLYEKGAGYRITAREAARLALVDSDNTALLMLWDLLEEAQLSEHSQSLNYLDVSYSIVEDGRVQIGARSYSSIIKCLYLACFNTKDDSELMLKHLSESSFTNRITKYLPKDLTVAHKIGTFSERYQSDCGLVYVPNQNYILCVMIEGDDPEASETIAIVSKLTYEFFK